MRIDKTVKGEKIPYYVELIPNSMKANVRYFQSDEKMICDISKNFKYIILPEDYETPYLSGVGKVKIDKLTLSSRQQIEVMEYNENYVKTNSLSLFVVKSWLDVRGYDSRITEIKVIEKDKCYIGDGKTIHKDRLMTINTKFIENHKSMRYYTYCKDGDQQKALYMLKAHIIEKVKKYKEEIDLTISHI